MTKRERFISAVSHRDTRPIPWTIELTVGETEKIRDFYKTDELDPILQSHVTKMKINNVGRGPIEGRPGYVKDHFGIVWNRSGIDKDIGIIENTIIPEPDMDLVHLPETPVEGLQKAARELLADPSDTFKYAEMGFTMFERAWSLRGGMEHFLMDMAAEPEFTEAYLDAICEYQLKIIDVLAEFPLDGMLFGDDWGQQRGLIMGPPHWRRLIKPRMERLYRRAHEAGFIVMQHSCGDIAEIYPDLIDIGLDVHQTFQPEIFDVKRMKSLYGRDLTFWGAISTQRVLPHGTSEEVKSETIALMRLLGEGGGYIAAPTHAVPADTPAENIDAMLDVFKHQEKYI